jgi:hypothetical protein
MGRIFLLSHRKAEGVEVAGRVAAIHFAVQDGVDFGGLGAVDHESGAQIERAGIGGGGRFGDHARGGGSGS